MTTRSQTSTCTDQWCSVTHMCWETPPGQPPNRKREYEMSRRASSSTDTCGASEMDGHKPADRFTLRLCCPGALPRQGGRTPGSASFSSYVREERTAGRTILPLGAVHLVTLLPPSHSGCLLAPRSGVHRTKRMMHHHCHGHADGLQVMSSTTMTRCNDSLTTDSG